MTSNSSNFCFNISSNSLTEEYWNVGGKLKIYGQVTAALLLFFILIGLPWNLLVVITILRKRLYHTSTIMLLLNLALADLLFLLTNMPVTTVTGIAGEYIVGNTDMIRCQTCFVTGFFTVVVMMDSLFVITLMSIDRFLFFYRPLKYERIVNTKTILLAITVAAILSIALGLFPFATPNKYIFLPYYQTCHFPLRQNWINISVIVFFCLALFTIIFVCNIWIVYIVQKNIKQVYNLRKIPCNGEKSDLCLDTYGKIKKERHKKQLHLFYVFGCLLLSTIITGLPHLIIASISLFIDVPVIISSPGLTLFLSQVVVHPMIETFLIRDVREPLKKIITCGLLKKKNIVTMAEERTPSYSICCGHVNEDKHSRCFILRLMEEALLYHDQYTNTHFHSDQNG